MLKRLVFPLFLLLTCLNIFFASWSVLHQDIHLYSDIARDMFLLQEIDQKKLVLIGPRSSAGGLFHGPLWSYLTYPGYVIGNGDPVIVGWYWIFLIIVFLITSYFIAKKLFGKNTAMLFVLMTSLYLAFHADALFNPYGAMFLIPLFFFLFIRYIQTSRPLFLALHILTSSAIIQFQMAIGIPLLILSFLYIAIFSIKKHHLTHLLLFLIVPVALSNFLLFDLRHELILSKNVVRHLGTSDPARNIFDLISDRLGYIFTRLEFLRFGPPHGQFFSVLIFFLFLLLQIKNNINRKIYFVFLYFYFGFFILSLFNRYNLLPFYVFPVLPFMFLIFSSFITGKTNRIFLPVFIIMYLLNIIGIYNHIKSLDSFIGKDQYSWKAVFNSAKTAYEGDEKEFGYFVYAPDIMGYSPRYAMVYAQKTYNKNGFAFEKKPITYLLIEPPARDNPFTSEQKWKLHQIHIYSKPTIVKTFECGYKVEKHILSAEELNTTFDPGINPGLHYR